jgi:hypothetical protein
MIPEDIAGKLAESLQALEDAHDLLLAALWCDQQEEADDDRGHGIARVALRDGVTQRFRDGLDRLKAVVRAADPTLVEQCPDYPIGAAEEAWLRRLLDTIEDDSKH